MKKLNCPFCNAGLTVPEDYVGGDVTCPSCGQTFFLEEDTPGAERAAGSPPPPPRRPQAAFRQRGPAAANPPPSMRFSSPPVTVAESRKKVGNWFIGLTFLAAILVGFGSAMEDGEGLVGLGWFLAGVLGIIEIALILSYLRTIALNSERR